MSAKNGSTRSFRLIGCLMAVAVIGSALFASVASAKKAAPTPTAYLALGDSLSFGYKAQSPLLQCCGCQTASRSIAE